MANFWQNFGKFLAAPCAFAFLSCATSRELEVLHEREAAREVLREIVSRDSIVERDSVFVELRGCTLREVRWREKWRVVRDVRRDTIRDTIRLADARAEEKKVEIRKIPFVFKVSFLGLALALAVALRIILRKKNF